jgi:hypothetical protein
MLKLIQKTGRIMLHSEVKEIKDKKKKVISPNSIKCGICNTEIRNRATIYRSEVYVRVICENCLRKFSSDDIELMINVFTAFGGYFAKNRKPDYIIYIILKEFKEELNSKGSSLSLLELKLKLLHKALLYGISPEKYFQRLKMIIK